ncbi:outer membrane protein [Methylocystis sp. JAN1]|uniref:outer membrane protein n=1 Tax=Methylocystis sp. JAN1 TaxID=3397211 RepID=UPI003FA22E21
MGRSFALLLAAAIVAGAGGAKAADLLPPPPPPIEPPPVEFGGWYLRGDVGVGATQISDWSYSLRPGIDNFGNVQVPAGPVWNSYHSLNDTAFAGAGVGYQVNSWFRFDLTGEYRIQSSYRAANQFTFPGCGSACYGFDQYNASLGTALFLANAYFDLGTWYGLTPFVGAGIGAAFHNFSGLTDTGFGVANGGYGFAADTNQTNFAWAVMGGLGYAVTPNLRLEVAYRYLDMGKITSNPISCNSLPCFGERHSFNVASNDIRVGFRYIIPTLVPPPPPPPGPLVRKY